MKPIACLVATSIAVALTAPVQAQVDCADRNAAAFSFVDARQLARLIYCSTVHSADTSHLKLVANVVMVPIIVIFLV